MNKENELELVLEQCEEVVNRKIPLLVLAPEYTKILLDYIKDLHNKIDKAIEFIEEYKIEKTYTDRAGFKVHTGTYFVEYAEDLLKILKDSDVDD